MADNKPETISRNETISRKETQVRNDTIKAELLTTSKTDAAATDASATNELDPVSSAPIEFVHIPGVSELLDRFNGDDLTALRVYFYEKKIDEKIKEPKGSAHPRFRGFKLKLDEFISAIESVLQTNEFDDAARELFERIVENNAEEHKGFLWWEQILDELIDFMSEKTKSRPGNIVKESFCSLYTMGHCRRETIVRVVPVETPTSFSFVVVSKYGKVGIYDWNMNLLEQYEVRLGTQIAKTAGGEVRRTTWVTDAVYMKDAATLLVAASDRSLHFYATTGLVCVPVYHISGLPNTPTCLHYTTSTKTDSPSMLLVGDDHGSISTMYFQQPQYALFKRTSNDALDRYFWKELNSQKAWVIITMDHGVHKDEITRVEYFSDNNTVVSCSNDPNTTVIIRYLVGRRAPYVFKISRGVRCFHLDRSLRLLVTGGKDSVVRLWNPIIPKKPVVSLFGHKTSIVDVRIVRHISVILSMSKDTVVKVWDIVGQTCMQSLALLFPVHGMLARTPEFGVQSFYQGPVSCKPVSDTSEGSIASTEIVLSPRTLTASSSKSIFASSNRARSKGNTTLSVTVQDSVHIIHSENSKIDTESVQTEASDRNKLETVESVSKEVTERLTKSARTITQYTIATEKSDVSATCIGSPWARVELLAVSCNYVVILQLSERELDEGEERRVGDPLSPPLRNQDPAAPSPWLTVDSDLLIGLTDEDTQLKEDGATSIPPAALATLQKGLGEEMAKEFTSLATSCHGQDTLHTDLRQVRAMVDQCAPHLALATTEVETIPYTPAVAVHPRKVHRKVDKSHDKSKLPRTSMVTDESKFSFTPQSTMGNTTTTSSSTSKSNRSRL